MGLFDKKKIPPGKNVPLGPPNLDKMEDEGLEGIKGEVGFPEESHDELAEDFPEEQQEYSGFGESETAETAETAETEPTNEGEEYKIVSGESGIKPLSPRNLHAKENQLRIRFLLCASA